MSTTVLIATVGGSCAPVVRAVLDHRPDRVHFICSAGKQGSSRLVDGPGDVCGDGRRCPHCKEVLGDPRGLNIAAQSGLGPDRFEKFEVDRPDDVGACFASVVRAYERALALDPDVRVIADYTGGTKTMTAALLRAATTRYGAISRLSVVKGERTDLRAVQDGTEAAWIQDAGALGAEDEWQSALSLANDYHYASADALLTLVRRRGASALESRVQALSTLCRGFDAWDRFDHAAAQRLLRAQGALVGPYLGTLGAILDAANALPGAARAHRAVAPQAWDAGAILLVHDLLLNAERRATQGRYDDAVARQYRALELLAQLRLWAAHGIWSSDVDRERAADWLAANPSHATDGRIQIGLAASYSLLLSLNDPVGELHRDMGGPILELLKRRNASILAHGLTPITGGEYRALGGRVPALVARAAEATGVRLRAPEQFPQLEASMFREPGARVQ